MASMRRLVAVVMVVAALPALAQRGGGTRGGSVGRGSSFAGHISTAAPAFRSAAPSMHPSYSGNRPGYGSAPRYNGSASAYSPMAARGSTSPYTHRRPIYYPGPSRYRAPYYGVGPGFGYVSTWLGPTCFDITDCNYYDESAYDAGSAPADYPAQNDSYPARNDPAQDYSGPYAPPPEPAKLAPSAPYRQAYHPPLPEPQDESAVTLIYKDGHIEQVHNYMLTRTTFYVQDQQRREIAIGDLDLAATVKANKDAGVDFQIPGAGR